MGSAKASALLISSSARRYPASHCRDQGGELAGSWQLEAGNWKLEAGSWKLEAGSWQLLLR
jgi:hypothetical protein